MIRIFPQGYRCFQVGRANTSPSRVARARVLTFAIALLCVSASAFHAAGADTGAPAALIMELESSTFELSVRDARSGERGPTIRVVLGSPATSTPLGRFPLEEIILSPSWQPGKAARSTGARPAPASLDSPMGAVKIPFAAHGAIALHGGGDERALGKPISSGCVRATDADLLRVVAWLDGRDALSVARETHNGEVHRRFRRRIELIVR